MTDLNTMTREQLIDRAVRRAVANRSDPTRPLEFVLSRWYWYMDREPDSLQGETVQRLVRKEFRQVERLSRLFGV